jgi:hypothetical protein
MLERRTLTTLLGCALVFGVIWMRIRPGPRAEDTEALPLVPAVEATRPAAPERTEPPQPGEAISVLARVFAGALHVEARSAAACVAGDFNRDGWPDVAVTARPTECRLAELRGELANWTLQDPRSPRSRPADVRVEANERLLAIVHGHGPEGWRCDDARQAYLLKGAFARLETRSVEEVGSTRAVRSTGEVRSASDSRAATRRQGETLFATLDGSSGFLHWTGARYAWHQTKSTEAADTR